jgi:hypothetical protein
VVEFVQHNEESEEGRDERRYHIIMQENYKHFDVSLVKKNERKIKRTNVVKKMV